jgi:metal-responsive CopG/Arc/MetJ family transcriptional regulator
VGTPVTVRMPANELAALDDYIKRQGEEKPSRPEAIRRLVRWALKIR